MGDRDLALQMMGTFQEELVELHGKLDDALHGGELTQIQTSAHTLKGASLNAGGVALSHLCSEIEKKAKSGEVESDTELLKEKVDELALAIDQFRGDS